MKAACTVLFIFGVMLLISWPWIVGHQPDAHAPKRELATFSLRFGIYIITLMVVFFSTAVMASVVARRARAEFKEEAMANMKILIETTLAEHRKKDEGAHDA